VTIPEILERRGDLAQSSVYRSVAVLEQAGLVQRVVSSDEWVRFELAEDLPEHHHHVICSACGLVRDFTVPERWECSIDQALISGTKLAPRFRPSGQADLASSGGIVARVPGLDSGTKLAPRFGAARSALSGQADLASSRAAAGWLAATATK
jgi:hypothetical protein